MKNPLTNTLMVLLSTAVLGSLASYALPWWGLAPAAALAGLLFARKGGPSLIGGLLGGGLLWFAYAAAAASGEGQALTARMAELSGMGSPAVLMIVVALIGALLAGLGAWTGWQARRMVAG